MSNPIDIEENTVGHLSAAECWPLDGSFPHLYLTPHRHPMKDADFQNKNDKNSNQLPARSSRQNGQPPPAVSFASANHEFLELIYKDKDAKKIDLRHQVATKN